MSSPVASRRSWPLLLAGIGGVVAVAVATRWLGHADVHSAAVGSATTRSTEDAVRFLFVMALVLGVLCLIAVVASGGLLGGSDGANRPKPTVRSRVITVVTVIAVLLFALLLRHLLPSSSTAPQRGGGGGGGALRASPSGQGNTGDWVAVLVAAAVFATAVGGLLLWRSRRAAPPARVVTEEVARQAAVTPAFDLDGERDDRLAVLAAYRWLLEVLRLRGHGRRDSEAPLEHVDRVIPARDLRARARSVATAFELARYSQHPVSTELRTTTVAAARAVVAGIDDGPTSGAPS
jgi:hypothetical protein